MTGSVHLAARAAWQNMSRLGGTRTAETSSAAAGKSASGTAQSPRGSNPNSKSDPASGSNVAGSSESGGEAGSSSQEDTPHGSSFHAVLHQYWLSEEGDSSESSQGTGGQDAPVTPRAMPSRMGHAAGTRTSETSSIETGKPEVITPRSTLVSGADSKSDYTSASSAGGASGAVANISGSGTDVTASSSSPVDSNLAVLPHPYWLPREADGSNSGKTTGGGKAKLWPHEEPSSSRQSGGARVAGKGNAATSTPPTRTAGTSTERSPNGSNANFKSATSYESGLKFPSPSSPGSDVRPQIR